MIAYFETIDGMEGGDAIEVKVIMSTTLTNPIDFDFKPRPIPGVDTAVFGTDVTLLENDTFTVTVPAGDSSATAAIVVSDDALFEGDEKLTIEYADASQPVKIAGRQRLSLGIEDDDPVRVSLAFDAAASTEGTTVTLTAQLLDQSNSPILNSSNKNFRFSLTDTTVHLTQASWSGAGGSRDVETLPGSNDLKMTIPSGASTGSLTVKLTEDSFFENDQLLEVIYDSADAQAKDLERLVRERTSATLTIIDADKIGVVSELTILPTSAKEGQALTARVRLNKQNQTGRPIVISLASTPSTNHPASSNDYAFESTQLTIAHRTISAETNIQLDEDDRYEGTEYFVVSHTPSDPLISPSTTFNNTVVAIEDKQVDLGVGVHFSFTRDLDETSGTTTVQLELYHDNDNDGAGDPIVNQTSEVITVHVDLSGGPNHPATFLTDYVVSGSTRTGSIPIEIAVDSHTGTLTLAAIDDALFENDEEIRVSLVSALGVAAQAINNHKGLSPSTTTRLIDNDNAPGSRALTIVHSTMTENVLASQQFTLVLDTTNHTANAIGLTLRNITTLSQPSSRDFTAFDEELMATIPTRSREAVVNLPLNDDALFEGNEILRIQISSATDAALSTGTRADITLLDDEADHVQLSYLIVQPAIEQPSTDSTARIQVSIVDERDPNTPKKPLKNLTRQAIDFTFESSASLSTALLGADFVFAGSTTETQIVTIANNESSSTLTLRIQEDRLFETTETVFIDLVGSDSVYFDHSTTSIDIVDNDTVTLTLSPLDAGEEGQSSATFLVSLRLIEDYTTGNLTLATNHSPSPLTARFLNSELIRPDRALLGTDFSFSSATDVAVIPVGESTGVLTIGIHDDNDFEYTEVFVTYMNQIEPRALVQLADFVDRSTMNEIIDNEIAQVRMSTPLHTVEHQATMSLIVDLGVVNQTHQDITVELSFDDNARAQKLTSDNADKADYSAEESLTFKHGQSTQTLLLFAVDDSRLEFEETIQVALNTLHIGEQLIVDNNTTAIFTLTTPVRTVTSTRVVLSTSITELIIVDNESTQVRLSIDSHGHEGLTDARLSLALANGVTNGTTGDLMVELTLDSTRKTSVPMFGLFWSHTNQQNSSGTADILGLPSTMAIAINDHQTNYVLSVVDDDLFEGPESVDILINATQSYAPRLNTGSSVTLTIRDNDDADNSILTQLGLTQLSAMESTNGSSIELQATIEKVNLTQQPIEIRFNYTGSADSNDFTSTSILIPIGQASNRADIVITDDDLMEPTEDIIIEFDRADHKALILDNSRNRRTAEILDNDLADSRMVLTDPSTSNLVIEEGTTLQLSFIAQNASGRILTNGFMRALDIHKTYTGTSQKDRDFEDLIHSSIAIGQSTFTVQLRAIHDNLFELDETFTLSVWAANAMDNATSYGLTIDDIDDVGVRIEITETIQALEGTRPALATVSISKANHTGESLYLDLALLNTSTATSEHRLTTTTVAINNGSDRAQLSLQTSNDTLLEATETVTVTARARVNQRYTSSLISTQSQLTILDDELTHALLVVFPTDGSEVGPDPIDFSVSLRDSRDLDTRISYAWLANHLQLNPQVLYQGDAAAMDSNVSPNDVRTNDFRAQYFDPNQANPNALDFELAVLSDDLFETTETIEVKWTVLIAGSTSSLLPITIHDSNTIERGYTLSRSIIVDSVANLHKLGWFVEDDEIRENNNTLVPVQVTLTDADHSPLVNDTHRSIFVPISFAGRAVQNIDFTAAPTRVEILPGQTSATLQLRPINDDLLERDETIALSVNPNNLIDQQLRSYIDFSASTELTIVDDEGTTIIVTYVTTNANQIAEDEGAFEIIVTIDSTNSSGLDLEFDLLTTGTANQDSSSLDFRLSADRLRVRDGERSASIFIYPTNDSILELDETIHFALAIDWANIVADPLQITLIDDEYRDQVDTLIYVIDNGQESDALLDLRAVQTLQTTGTSTPIQVGIKLHAKGNPLKPVINGLGDDILFTIDDNSLNLDSPARSASSTQSAHVDLIVSSRTQVSIADGDSEGIVAIPVIDDLLFEDTEETILFIEDVTSTVVLKDNDHIRQKIRLLSDATALIFDNEALSQVPIDITMIQPGLEGYTVSEASSLNISSEPIVFELKLLLENNTHQPIDLNLRDIIGGSALRDIDYQLDTTQATIVEGQIRTTFAVTVLTDEDIETTETMYINFVLTDQRLNYPTNPAEGLIIESGTDTDEDGLVDLYETRISLTDPNNPDTDGDGLTDGEEVLIFIGSELLGVDRLNPLVVDSDNNGTDDGLEDYDQDGLNNIDEMRYKSNPYDSDTDGDGLLDGEEVFLTSTSPILKDTDDDNIIDALEDADSDSINNIEELRIYNLRPDLNDTDGNGYSDFDDDADGDGVRNGLERQVACIAQGLVKNCEPNTDEDGDDLHIGVDADSDNDGVIDSATDSDGDSLTDNIELMPTVSAKLPVDPSRADLPRLDGRSLLAVSEVDPNSTTVPAQITVNQLEVLATAFGIQRDLISQDSDYDKDGLTDVWELQHGLMPTQPDASGCRWRWTQ